MLGPPQDHGCSRRDMHIDVLSPLAAGSLYLFYRGISTFGE